MKYTKKPITIDAVEWTGKNEKEVMDFLERKNAECDKKTGLGIFTLEGRMQANIGDFIIKGIQGEFYPCKPNIFHQMYSKAHYISNQTATEVNQLVSLCHGLAVDAGWHKEPREIGTMLCLIHSEISEAMEGDRKDLMDDHIPSRKMIEVELADAVIRICDLSGKLKLDLGGALIEKLAYNKQRADHKPENRNSENGKKY